MVPCENRIVEHSRRFKLVPVEGEDDVFDFVPMPGKITSDGTPLNELFFDKLQNNIESIKNCVGVYNIPEILPYDSNNHLVLKNEIPEYFKGLRVFIDIPAEYEIIDGNMIPAFSSNSDDINGLKVTYSGAVTDAYKAYDGESETYAQKPSGSSTTNTGINLSSTNYKYYPLKGKIKFWSSYKNVGFNIGLYNNGWTEKITKSTGTSSYTWLEQEFELSGNTPICDGTNLMVVCSASSEAIEWRIAEIQITEYKVEKISSGVYSYININGLGEKLINQKIEMGKKYELVYDGTAFNATEVA